MSSFKPIQLNYENNQLIFYLNELFDQMLKLMLMKDDDKGLLDINSLCTDF